MKYLLCYIALFIGTILSAQPKTVIIDADTGNEVDDPYAIARALVEPSWKVVGLNSTQWQITHWNIPKTMENSYRLNGMITTYMGLNEMVPVNKGAETRLFDWGPKEQPSRSALEIIKYAHQMPEGEKLHVIALGALTNVASAILMDPKIEDKIALYWLGTKYNFEEGYLTKVDFNCSMDIQAVDVLFNSMVEMHVFPVSLANQMTFDWAETNEKLKGKHDLFDFLINRWYNHLDAGRYERVIWDLTIVDALIFPEKVEEVKVLTSKENGGREVYYYKSFDSDFFRNDFFETLLNWAKTN